MDFTEFSKDKIVVFDGAFGTELQKRIKNAGTVPEMLNLERPEIIEQIM